MSYGRTAQQELELHGRRLLNRHYYGDGRWGMRDRTPFQESEWQGWRVIKQRPRRLTWAKPTGPLGRKIHAVRYSLTGTHLPTGTELHLTVWQCSGTSHSVPLPQSHPTVVCAGCHTRLSGRTEVVLT